MKYGDYTHTKNTGYYKLSPSSAYSDRVGNFGKKFLKVEKREKHP